MFVLGQRRQAHRRRSNGFAPVNLTIHGLLQGLANSILQPTLFLPGLVVAFGGSYQQAVGFVVTTGVTWALAPLLVNLLVSFVSKAFPVVIGASVVRIVALVALITIARDLRLPVEDDWLRWLFLTFLVYQVSTAVANGANIRLLAAAMPVGSRVRALRLRALASLIGGVVTSLLAWRVLGATSTDISLDFGVETLLVFSASAVLASMWFLFAIPANTRTTSRTGSNRFRPWRVLASLDSSRIRRFALFRVALGVGASANVFALIVGFEQLSISLVDVGIALVWFSLGHLVGHVVWNVIDRRFGPRTPLAWSALLQLIFLIAIVALPEIVTSSLYTDQFDSVRIAQRLFVVLFGIVGFGMSALAISTFRYVVEAIPPGRQQAAQQLANVLGAIVALVPLGAAWIANDSSPQTVMVIAMGCAFAALLFSGLLSETRIRPGRRR